MAATVLGSGCAHGAPASRPRIRAVAFDLFTVFDPRGIDAAVAGELGDPEFAALWKRRAFEYCWLRAAAEQYVPFDQIIADALDHALAARQRTIAPAVRRRLLGAWTELVPWPDSAAALARLRARGLRLAPLANFAPAMIRRLLEHASLHDAFDVVISTDAAKSYKPARRAYQLGVDTFGVPASSIAFSAFGGWDAAGASWFGYRTFWVNRFGLHKEQLAGSIATGRGLTALAEWLSA